MAATYAVAGTLDIKLAVTNTKTDAQNSGVDALRSGTKSFPSLKGTLGSGTGPNNAKFLWHQQRTVNATTNDDIDLTSLTDFWGQAVAFTLVKWFLLRIVGGPVAGET